MCISLLLYLFLCEELCPLLRTLFVGKERFLEYHCSDKRKCHNHCGRYRKWIRLFLLGVRAVRIVSKFVLDDFVVIRRFEVGKFRAFFPACIGIASAMRAERGIFFDGGMTMRTEHACNITKPPGDCLAVIKSESVKIREQQSPWY